MGRIAFDIFNLTRKVVLPMIIQIEGDVVKLRGALTENQWPALRSAVALTLKKNPRGVILDATELTEVSESGAHTFLDASQFIQSQNARVVVAGLPSDILEEIRKIPGVRSQLAVTTSIKEARASLESGGMAAHIERMEGPSVLVPLIGEWQRALEFAAAQAFERRAEILLLYVLQVPRNLPLGVPVPELEQEAERILTEAERASKRRGVKVRRLVTRSRDVMEGAARFAADTKSDLVVLAFAKDDLARDDYRCTAMNTFCHEVAGDLAVLCVDNKPSASR